MKLETADLDFLRPLIVETVKATLAEIGDSGDVSRPLAVKQNEAARLLGVQPWSLRDMRLRGEIRGSKLGKSTVYRIVDLERLLRQREQ